MTSKRTRGRDPDEPLYHDPHSAGKSHGDRDRDVPSEHDGRSNTRTMFIPSEGDDTAFYQSLRREHERADSGERQNTDQERRLATWASALELTEHQRSRVEYHRQEIAIDDHGSDIETVGLALITLVANLDDRAIRREQQFTEIREALGVTSSNLNHARESLRTVVLGDERP